MGLELREDKSHGDSQLGTDRLIRKDNEPRGRRAAQARWAICCFGAAPLDRRNLYLVRRGAQASGGSSITCGHLSTSRLPDLLGFSHDIRKTTAPTLKIVVVSFFSRSQQCRKYLNFLSSFSVPSNHGLCPPRQDHAVLTYTMNASCLNLR